LDAPPRPIELSENDAEWAALLAVDLMTRPKDWILRRIESVSFDDDRMATRRVVVDFRVPRARQDWSRHRESEVSGQILPLALMQKRRIRVFQLVDEKGRLCPTLTRATRTYVGCLALVSLAEEILEGNVVAEVHEELESMATSPVSAAFPIHQEFVQAALLDKRALANASQQVKQRAALFGNESFRVVAYALTWSYLLLVHVPGDADARRTMSFSYEERLIDRPRRDATVPPYATVEQRPSRWEQSKWRFRDAMRLLGRVLGWAPRRFDFPCASVAYGCTYHLEIEAPAATLISFGGLFLTDSWSPSRNPHSLSREDTMKVLERRTGPDDWERGSLRRSHLYLSHTPTNGQGIAEVRPRPERGAFVQGIALTAALSTALLFAGLHFRTRLVDVGAGTTLLLVLPTALVIYVTQPASDHALAARLLTAIRGFGILVGLCLILAAGALVVAEEHDPPSAVAWSIAAYTSAFALVLLIGSWIQARPRRYRSQDRGDGR
jgi:hypothetical protein